MPIDLSTADTREREVWLALLDLADRVKGWTLIGARMVQLHAAERGRLVPRVSIDADALADARDRRGTERLARALMRQGFELDEPSNFGVGHVFRRGGVEIDVLAPARPDLLGAILIKARAVDIDDTPENQRLDLALLLSFVDDPAALATELRPSERGWLRRRQEMDDPGAECWSALPLDDRQRGLFALRTLARFVTTRIGRE